MPNILSVSNVSKEFTLNSKNPSGGANKISALNHVSFELINGLYGLLGPNGAGKSTLINAITGNVKPTSGTISWNGKPANSANVKFRRVLGYMPQQQGLYESFTGYQFLAYLCALKEIKRKDMTDEVQRVAASVNLLEELSKSLGAYSGGMKQRLLLAAALIGNPQLLILDEPTAGLDPKERFEVREMLSVLAQSKVILVATHVVSDIEDAANEVLLLKKGHLIDKASPAQLIYKYSPKRLKLEDVYLTVFEKSV